MSASFLCQPSCLGSISWLLKEKGRQLGHRMWRRPSQNQESLTLFEKLDSLHQRKTGGTSRGSWLDKKTDPLGRMATPFSARHILLFDDLPTCKTQQTRHRKARPIRAVARPPSPLLWNAPRLWGAPTTCLAVSRLAREGDECMALRKKEPKADQTADPETANPQLGTWSIPPTTPHPTQPQECGTRMGSDALSHHPPRLTTSRHS